MQHPADDVWQVPVVGVSAVARTGIDELRDALLLHRNWIATHPATPRQLHRRRMALHRAIEMQVMESIQQLPEWQYAIDQLADATSNVDEIATAVIQRWRHTVST
jgi:putative protein kinase ArgK-like GTPase of G3E family